MLFYISRLPVPEDHPAPCVTVPGVKQSHNMGLVGPCQHCITCCAKGTHGVEGYTHVCQQPLLLLELCFMLVH